MIEKKKRIRVVEAEEKKIVKVTNYLDAG